MKHSTIITGLILMTNITGAGMSYADDSEKANQQRRAEILETIWNHLETHDSWKAAAFVEAQGKPPDIADLYSNLIRDLYGKKHDVPRMVLIGRAGIDFCLRESAQAAKRGDEQLATELKGMAKVMSYNVSVNTWPAWEDEGIVITRSDQRIGLDAAQLNLRLAKELRRGPDKVGNAYWLLGAHQIALGQHKAAIEHLRESVRQLAEAKKPDFELMCRGYVAIAKLARNRKDVAAQQQLDESVAALKQMSTDDAKFFAEQLISVNQYFAK